MPILKYVLNSNLKLKLFVGSFVLLDIILHYVISLCFLSIKVFSKKVLLQNMFKNVTFINRIKFRESIKEI